MEGKKEVSKGKTSVSPNVEEVYVSGGFGIGYSRDSLSILIMRAMPSPEAPDEEEYRIDHIITMSPRTAKRLADALSEFITKYEEKYGKIILTEEEETVEKKK